jgi:drug/metabolite transporter (DMT)-like permease
MARRVAGVRHELAVATAAVVAVASTLSAAALVEAVNDRDWSIGDWEWLGVAVLAVVSTFGAFWLLVTLAPRVVNRHGPHVDTNRLS